MEQIAIYLWSISENIKISVCIAGCFLLMGSPFLFMFAELGVLDWKSAKDALPLFKKILITGSVLIILSLLIPAKKDLALIFLYPHIKNGTETVVKSETMNKMKQLTNLYLDEQIKNLKDNKDD